MPKGNGIPYNEAIPMLADALAYYDEDDVRRWFERHERMTGRLPLIFPSTIDDVRTFRKVPNEPFRRPFLALSAPLILGQPVAAGAYEGGTKYGEPEWCGLFREELQHVIALPEGFDSRPEKIGPGELSCQRIGDYLRSALGIKAHAGRGGITLSWLVQYEIAEVLCKTLGLAPHTVGV